MTAVEYDAGHNALGCLHILSPSFNPEEMQATARTLITKPRTHHPALESNSLLR